MTANVLVGAIVFFIGMISYVGAGHADFVGTVSKIYDGDTFGLCNKTQCIKVRICGIDAPESGANGSQSASTALASLVKGKIVRCVQVGQGTVCDGRSRATNRDRVVAQCFVGESDIAASLVRGGFACDWMRFSGGAYGGPFCP